jgi:hypothetical protein
MLSQTEHTQSLNADYFDSRSADAAPARIAALGSSLVEALTAALSRLPEFRSGPQRLAERLGVDKVVASRLLKGLSGSSLEALHRLPGPAPLRRVLAGCDGAGVPRALVAAAERAVAEFERLIRDDAGDRSALETVLSACVPSARREFELRRKQTAFRAMSQLKGAEADVLVAAVLVAPGADPQRLDVVWVSGLLGLQRLRPGVPVKFATRRFLAREGARRPTTLDGAPVDDLGQVRLDEFCSSPPPTLRATRIGEVVQYALGDAGYGAGHAADLSFCEVNRAELPRYLAAGSARRSYFFAEVQVPCRAMLLDVLVHRDLFPAGSPELRIYDTALEGVADANDPARDADRFDLDERITTPLSWRAARAPRHADVLAHVFGRLGWDEKAMRLYRCEIDYPIYGSQVAMLFEPERR